MELEVAVKWQNVKFYCPCPSEYILKRDSSVTGSTFPARDPVVNEPGQAHGPRKLQFQPNGCQVQLFENFTLVQKVATTFRMVCLLASGICGTVFVVVPLRTFVSTITGGGIAIKSDIYTDWGRPPSSKRHPWIRISTRVRTVVRMRTAIYKKRADDCRECFHFIAIYKSLARISP